MQGAKVVKLSIEKQCVENFLLIFFNNLGYAIYYAVFNA